MPSFKVRSTQTNNNVHNNWFFSHVYFWSSDRKWCFILTCAGVPFGSNGSCIDLDELYPLLDQTAINYDIKGSWVVVVKKTFPNLNPMMDDDTPTGLLRFIKSYYDKRISLDIEPNMFKSFILTSFPVLPLSLYRMLQPTTWMKHPAFIHFSTIGWKYFFIELETVNGFLWPSVLKVFTCEGRLYFI